jgi:hypothetical protein
MSGEEGMVPRGGIERATYVTVPERIFYWPGADDTNKDTNNIFLWIGAIPIYSG